MELTYAAGASWKIRAVLYLLLQLGQLATLAMTLLHFAQHGYYVYLFVLICIVILTCAVSLMFTTSVN